MKKVLTIFLVIFFLSLIPFSAGADFKKTKIAVLDFALKGQGFETEDMGGIVAEWFITAFVKEGRFDVIERGLLKKIMDEHALGLSGAVDESTATKIGKILGVKVIISGSVMKLSDKMSINARIIDVETASIIAAEHEEGSAAVQLQDLVVEMSTKIIKNFPLEGYVVSRERDENLVAIDLGKLAGVKQNMEFFVFKEGKVIKHPKTGEVLDVQSIKIGRIVITNARNKISHGEIYEEEKAGAVRVGHRVKSISPLVPEKRSGTVDWAVKKYKRETPISKNRRPTTVPELAALMLSSNMRDKTLGARYTARLFPTHPELLQIAERELLNGYQLRTRNRHHINAMAWMCNVLGQSGNRQYKETLYEVARHASNRNLRKYGKKNYRKLR